MLRRLCVEWGRSSGDYCTHTRRRRRRRRRRNYGDMQQEHVVNCNLDSCNHNSKTLTHLYVRPLSLSVLLVLVRCLARVRFVIMFNGEEQEEPTPKTLQPTTQKRILIQKLWVFIRVPTMNPNILGLQGQGFLIRFLQPEIHGPAKLL